jgi:hypothetical protein
LLLLTIQRLCVGYDQSSLILCNKATQSTIISAIEKLFRIPESAGQVSIMYSTDEQMDSNLLPLRNLNDECQRFYDVILNYRSSIGMTRTSMVRSQGEAELSFATPTNSQRSESEVYYGNRVVIVDDDISPRKRMKANSSNKSYTTPLKSPAAISKSTKDSVKSSSSATQKKSTTTTKKSASQTKGKKASKPEEAEENTDEEWSKSHESIGMKVSKKFGADIYTGEVIRYLPPSKPGASDALYHILYTDGDEEDMSDDELAKGRSLYIRQPVEWTDNHHTIGTKVSRKRNITTSESEGENNLKKQTVTAIVEHGMVLQYAVGRLGNDQLYEINWENGVTEQLNEKKFRAAFELYVESEAAPLNHEASSSSTSVENIVPAAETQAASVDKEEPMDVEAVSMDIQKVIEAVTEAN